MVKNNHQFLLCASLMLLVFMGCGEIVLPEGMEEEHTLTPEDSITYIDSLITQNDTALFYMSGMEIRNVQLSSSPTPSDLIKGSRYRLPTKLEVFAVLKHAPIPDGYWISGQRILCYDSPNDIGLQIGSTHFGSGLYYTYIPNGTIVKAGYKTKYCILPIRTERLIKRNDTIIIGIDDCWEN